MNEVNEVNEVNDQVDNEAVESGSNNESSNEEKGSRVKWFHEDSCTACTVGLSSRMKELLDTGMSQRKAAEIMSEEAKGEISADTIRKRYRYYNDSGRGKKAGETSHLNKGSNEIHPGESCNPLSQQESQPEVSIHPPLPDL